MKNFLFIVVALFLLVAPAVAQETAPKIEFWAEEQTIVSGGEISPWINGLASRKFGEKLGAYLWFQVGEGWAQTYAGPTYSPRPWLQVGAGLGLEQANDSVRFGSFVWVGGGRCSLLSIYENGGGGHWYKSELNIKTTSWLGVGAIAQHVLGVGPRVQFNIPATRRSWSGAPRSTTGIPANSTEHWPFE